MEVLQRGLRLCAETRNSNLLPGESFKCRKFSWPRLLTIRPPMSVTGKTHCNRILKVWAPLPTGYAALPDRHCGAAQPCSGNVSPAAAAIFQVLEGFLSSLELDFWFIHPWADANIFPLCPLAQGGTRMYLMELVVRSNVPGLKGRPLDLERAH